MKAEKSLSLDEQLASLGKIVLLPHQAKPGSALRSLLRESEAMLKKNQRLFDALSDMTLLIDHLHEYPKCNARKFLICRDGSEHGSIISARELLSEIANAAHEN